MDSDLNRVRTGLLAVIAAGVVMAGLIYTRPVIVPFVISVFFFLILSPLVEYLCSRFKIPRMLAAFMAILLFLLVFGLAVFMVASSVDGFVRGADVYRDRVVELVNDATEISARFGYDLQGEELRKGLSEIPVLKLTRGLTGNAVNILGKATLVFIFVIFMLAGTSKTPAEAMPPLALRIRNNVSRYVATKMLTSFTTGTLVGILLFTMDVELALMFAVLTVLLNFIPSIGSIVATLLPIPVLLLQFGFGWQLYAVMGISGAIQFSIGNVIEPKLLGQSLDLHPVTVVMSLLFWGLVWGIPGMFIGVPLTAILKIVLADIKSTHPIAEVLAGRFPGY